MSLQNVVSDIIFDFFGEVEIRHGCIGIVKLTHEFILSLSSRCQQIKVDSEQDSVEDRIDNVDDNQNE